MRSTWDERKEKYLYRLICVFIIVISLIPVSRASVMNGGIVTEWILRIREIGTGNREMSLRLFPSAETIISAGIRTNAMNSNLWFWIPGLLYRYSKSIVFAYRVYMVGIQVGTFLGAKLLFARIFAKEEGKLPAFFGMLLYMTCPYRIYVCYDLANLSQAAAWMVLPLYIWAAAGIAAGEKKIRNVVVAVFALAGIGYADTVFFITALGMTLIAVILSGKIWMFVSMAGGTVLFLPGLSRLVRYVFSDYYYELDMPLRSIMPAGYRIGQFFSSYSFRDGHPGMGLGMFVCLLALIWIRFVENMGKSDARRGVCLKAALFFSMLSTCYFPWDVVQRIGKWALKMVCLIETPAVFWGMALLCLCVPAAYAVERLSRNENRVIAHALPVVVLLACVGICIYQSNILMQNRVLLELP